MKNVSGYLTDDGTFFQEKKAAEAHEKLLGIRKLIEEFVRDKYEKPIKLQIRCNLGRNTKWR